MATLKSLVDETTNIKDDIIECRDTWKQILIDKHISEAENENKLYPLITLLNDYAIRPSKKYLYKEGDECVDVTGGWLLCGNGACSDNSGYTLVNPVKNSTYISIGDSSSSIYGISQIKTSNLVNLSQYNTLYIDAEITSAYANGQSACSTEVLLFSTNPNLNYWITSNYATEICSKLDSTMSGRRIIQLDISNVTSAYILFKVYALYTPAQYRMENLYNIWVE